MWYTGIIEGILTLVNRDIRLNGDTVGELWKHLFAHELYFKAKECFGKS
jgi:hypothetical protein